MAATTEGLSLPVMFTTQTAYPLPSQKFMIPSSWKRYHLSQLINKALSLLKPVPFDFLVRGEVLRGTLAEWCMERNVGTEVTLELEYIESVIPPQLMSGMPHDDWVSSVTCQLPTFFVTASYDACIRVFDSSQILTHSISGHSAAISSIYLLPSTNPDTHVIASASHDMTARLTSISLTSPAALDNPMQVPSISSQALASLHLHTAPLSSISSTPSGSHLLTTSWDGLIGLWDASVPETDEVPVALDERKKRRKVGDAVGEDGAARPKRKAALSVLKSHTRRVTKAIFGREGSNAFSCGLDSTVRMWDVESGVCVNTLTAAEKPFLDVILTADSNTALVSSTDRSVTAYDARHLSSPDSTSPSTTSFTHPATPACLAASPTNAHQFVSGAYDGVVRLWDLRSAKGAIASFTSGVDKGAAGKVLAVDWARGIVGVGGERGLDVWKVGDEGAT